MNILVRTTWWLAIVLSALVAAMGIPQAVQAQGPIAFVTNIRAAHHPGFDRVVFDFEGAFPTTIQHGYVSQLTSCGSGAAVPIPGNAIYRVRFTPAQAHANDGSWVVPNQIAFGDTHVAYGTLFACDFEADVDVGIVMGRHVGQPTVFRLTNPNRLVLDFPTSSLSVQTRQLYFVNANANVRAVSRPVITPGIATSVLQRLYMGPTRYEQSQLGLQFVSSESTGFTQLRIANGIARVQLTGGCNSGGATVTVANEIMPTLLQFATVDWVKIYDPQGRTERPAGRVDSIPECLEP